MTRLSTFAALLLIVSAAPPALADPLYALTDLGAVSAGHDVQYGTGANGQGYVTNTDGVEVSPFQRSTVTLSGDAGLVPMPLPYGSVVHPEFLTSQGVIAGTVSMPPTSEFFNRDTTYFYQQYGAGLRYITVGQGGYIRINDINSSAVAVGMQPLGPSWDLSSQQSPAVLSPYNQSGPLASVYLADVVKVPGWSLVLPAWTPVGGLQPGPMRIDDSGRIVGYGYDNGSLHAYLLTPSSLSSSVNPVPEPTSLAVFAIVASSILAPPALRRMRSLRDATRASGTEGGSDVQ